MKNIFFTKTILIIEIMLCFAIGFLTIIAINKKIDNKPLMIAKTIKPVSTTINTGGKSTSSSRVSTSTSSCKATSTATSKTNKSTATCRTR